MLALTFTFSCSGGDGTSSPSGGGDLVNANNEAWVALDISGYIFKQNGELMAIYKLDANGNWCMVSGYNYRVSGNEIKVCYGTCHVLFESYSISGNTLLVEIGNNEMLFTRKSMNTSSLIPCEE